MVSFLWRCRYRRIGAPWSRRRRLPLVVPRPSSTLWGFSASPAGRPDSFHSVFLWSGFTSPGLLSYFRFGRTESGARTLRVVLESFCVHSPAHASFYLFWGGSSCLPCFFSLESAFLRGGVHPYHSVLSLWSSSLAGVRLSPALALSSLVVWCSGRTALFLFLLAGAVPAFLPAALSVATLSFSVGPVCSSFSAEACAILCTLCWSGKRHGVCCFSSLLLLSGSHSVLAALSSPPSFFRSRALWRVWRGLSSLSSCSIGLQWVPGHSFSRGREGRAVRLVG